MHYFNPAVETDKDILLGPIFQLKMRKASFESVKTRKANFESVGVLSELHTFGEIEELWANAQGEL